MKSRKMLKPAALLTAAAIATTAVVASMSTTFGAEENEYKWVASMPDEELRNYDPEDLLTPGQKIEGYGNGVKSVSSSNNKVAKGQYVRNNASMNYRITANSQPGIATIAMSNKLGGLVTTNYLVKNNTAYIESYELKKKAITISQVGGTDDVKLYVDKINEKNVADNLWSTITWTSYDENIAQITEDGKVTAKAKGNTILKGAFIDCYGEQQNMVFALSAAPSTGGGTSSDTGTQVTFGGQTYIDHGDNTFTIINSNGSLGERVGGGSDHDPSTSPVHNIVVIDGKPYILCDDDSTLIGVNSEGQLESNGQYDIPADVEVIYLNTNQIVTDDITGKVYINKGKNLYQEAYSNGDGTYTTIENSYVVAGMDCMPGTSDDNLLSGRTTARGGQIEITNIDPQRFTYRIKGAKDKYYVTVGKDGLLGTYDDTITATDGSLGIALYDADYNTKKRENVRDVVWHVTWLYMGGTSVNHMKLISEYNFYAPQQWKTMTIDPNNLADAESAIKSLDTRYYSNSTISSTMATLYTKLGSPNAIMYTYSSNSTNNVNGLLGSSSSSSSNYFYWANEPLNGSAHIYTCPINHTTTTGKTGTELLSSHSSSISTYTSYVSASDMSGNSSYRISATSNNSKFFAPSISELTAAFGDAVTTSAVPANLYKRGRSERTAYEEYGEYWLRSTHNSQYMHACTVTENGVISGTRKIYESAQLRPCCMANLTVS